MAPGAYNEEESEEGRSAKHLLKRLIILFHNFHDSRVLVWSMAYKGMAVPCRLHVYTVYHSITHKNAIICHYCFLILYSALISRIAV